MLHMDREPYIQHLKQQHEQEILRLKQRHRKAVQKLKKELRDGHQDQGPAHYGAKESLGFGDSGDPGHQALKQELKASTESLLEAKRAAKEAKRDASACKQEAEACRQSAEQVHVAQLRQSLPDSIICLRRNETC